MKQIDGYINIEKECLLLYISSLKKKKKKQGKKKVMTITINLGNKPLAEDKAVLMANSFKTILPHKDDKTY